MKNNYILFSLVGIMISSNMVAMEQPIKPALTHDFYTTIAKSYVIAHKNHPHFRDNLKQKKDWLQQKLHTHRKKMLTLHVTKKDGKTYKVQGLNPLPNLQDYLSKITQIAKKNNDSSLENLFRTYLSNLNHVWKMSLFMRLKRYCGDHNQELENKGLSQISEHIFKNALKLWSDFHDIDKIYAIEALHFTQTCLDILKNENLTNQNSNSSSDDNNSL